MEITDKAHYDVCVTIIDGWLNCFHAPAAVLLIHLLLQVKMSERNNDKVKHLSWALQQREIFRRQRHEIAMRYAKAGAPPRMAYSALPSTRASRYETSLRPSIPSSGQDSLSHGYSNIGSSTSPTHHSNGKAAAFGNMMDSWSGFFASSPPPPTVSLPKQTYPNVYRRMASEVGDAMESSAIRTQRKFEERAIQKEEAETNTQLEAMDLFEKHIQARNREKNRSMFSNGGAQEEDEYDD